MTRTRTQFLRSMALGHAAMPDYTDDAVTATALRYAASNLKSLSVDIDSERFAHTPAQIERIANIVVSAWEDALLVLDAPAETAPERLDR